VITQNITDIRTWASVLCGIYDKNFAKVLPQKIE